MMDCLHSMAPNDEELLRHALDDEPLEKATREHVEHCSICQQRLASYKRTNIFLLSHLYRSQCPDATELNHYCANMLAIDDVLRIVEHLEMCPLCAAEVLEIRQVLANFEPFLELDEAPFFSGEGLKRIIASLVPWQPQLVTRGEQTRIQDTPWPRQYRAETLNLSLHLSRTSSGESILLGLFSSTNLSESIENLEGVPVELYQVPGPEVEQNGHVQGEPDKRYEKPLMCTTIDDLGNVVFKAVPTGEYTMIVCLPQKEMVIKGLVIELS